MSDLFLPLDGDGEAIEYRPLWEVKSTVPSTRWCTVCKDDIAPGASHNSAAHAFHAVQGTIPTVPLGKANDDPMGNDDPSEDDEDEFQYQRKATNWTRDGVPIENGFEVLTREEAGRIPFLDLAKVNISEQHECPDCNEHQWLSHLASCSDCATLKCRSCMASMGPIFGQCKKCASWNSAIHDALLDDGDPRPDNQYLDYLLNSETEEPLFLPGDNNYED